MLLKIKIIAFLLFAFAISSYGQTYFKLKNSIVWVDKEDNDLEINISNYLEKTNLFKKVHKNFFKGYSYEKSISLNNRIFVITYLDKTNKNEDNKLYYQEIEINTGELIGENKLLTSNFDKSINFQSRDFCTSFDESKLSIINRFYDKKTKIFEMRIYGFTSDLKPISSQIINLPLDKKTSKFLTYKVDSDGNTYILVKTKNEDKKSKIQYKAELIKIKPNNNQYEHINISTPDKNIKSGVFTEKKDKNFICALMYNIDDKLDGVSGIVTFNIDMNGMVLNTNNIDIPISIINKYQNPKDQKDYIKQQEDGKLRLENLVFTNNIYVNEDNSIVLNGEQYSVFVSNNGGTSHYYDILSFKIDKNGKLIWMQKIPKIQIAGSGPFYSGFNFFINNGNFYYVFSDLKENLVLNENKRVGDLVSNQKGQILVCHKVNNATGENTKSLLLEEKIYLHNIINLGNNELGVLRYENKEKIFTKIKLP